MSQSESRRNFVPTDQERRVLLELLQSPQESLVSIANELDITLAALTIYLATDDAATLFAQADLANARRARTAAAAQLEQCVGALSLMISDWVTDVTHNLRRETPKSRREQDREQESTRRAATLIYRIANFTPRTITAVAPPLPAKRGEVPESARGWGAVRGITAHLPPATSLSSADIPASTNPTRQRGATDAPITPPPTEDQSHPQPAAPLPASPSPEHEQAGCVPTSEMEPGPSPQAPSASECVPMPSHPTSHPRNPTPSPSPSPSPSPTPSPPASLHDPPDALGPPVRGPTAKSSQDLLQEIPSVWQVARRPNRRRPPP